MDQSPLLVDGKDEHERLRQGHFLPKRLLTFGDRVKQLSPYGDRFAFFTPAVLYLWGRFPDQILFHFLEHQGCRVDFFHMKFARPLFQGLTAPNGDADWNHVLWAIERPHWQAFEDHVLAAVLTDTPRGLVIRYGAQDLAITDPVANDQSLLISGEIPLCPITAFGVRSNLCQISLVSRAPGLVPDVVWHGSDAQCNLYASVMFQQRAPEQAVELMRTEGQQP